MSLLQNTTKKLRHACLNKEGKLYDVEKRTMLSCNITCGFQNSAEKLGSRTTEFDL